MLTDGQREHLGQTTRTLQIIVAALVCGVLTIAVVIVAIGTGGEDNDLPLLTYLGACVAVPLVIVWRVVPRQQINAVRQRLVAGQVGDQHAEQRESTELGDVGALSAAFLTSTIIAIAILEGGALLNLIAYFLEGRPLSLVVVAILLAMIITHFPTRARAEDWATSELRTVEQLRQLQPGHA